MELGAQPRPGFAAERRAQAPQDHGPTHRALRCGGHDLWQALGEGLGRTGGVQAPTAAGAEEQAHGILPHRQIIRAAGVIAVNARRGDPAARALAVGAMTWAVIVRSPSLGVTAVISHHGKKQAEVGTVNAQLQKGVIRLMEYGSIHRPSHFCRSTAAAGEPKAGGHYICGQVQDS